MLKVYIAGPYRADTENGVAENIIRARIEASLWWQAGAAPFCPHLNTAQMGGLVSENAFIQGDLEWLRCASVIVMLPGWRESTGAKGEFQAARELGLLRVHRLVGLLTWTLEDGKAYKGLDGLRQLIQETQEGTHESARAGDVACSGCDEDPGIPELSS